MQAFFSFYRKILFFATQSSIEVNQGFFDLARDFASLLHYTENSRLITNYLVEQAHFRLILGRILNRFVHHHLDEALCSILVSNLSEIFALEFQVFCFIVIFGCSRLELKAYFFEICLRREERRDDRSVAIKLLGSAHDAIESILHLFKAWFHCMG